MTENDILRELVKLGDIEKVTVTTTTMWLNNYYQALLEEYQSRMFNKKYAFKDTEYNHENEKELLKDIDIKKVYKNLYRD